jgi:predicted Zn-dependent peptidase
MARTWLPGILLLTMTACPGTAPQPEAPTLPGSGAIPGDDPRPPGAGNGGDERPAVNPGTEPAPQPIEVADEPFRATQPAAGKPRPLNIPPIQTFVLDNGIRAYLVERHDLPVVSLDLVFDGGTITDPAGKRGLASVCMDLLTEGTIELDKIAFNEAKADLASDIGSWASVEEQGIRMSSLTAQLDKTQALLVATLLRPGMRAEDFDRLIKQRLEGIKQAKGNAAGVMGRVSGSVLYGLDHPYGRITTEASLGALTLDDCKTYVATWLKPQGARLFIAGDLTRKQVEQRFGKAGIASWSGKAPALPAMPAPKARPGRIFFAHVAGAEQSQVYLGHFGPKRKAPDFFATMLAGQVYGGGFAGRVNMNLREDKGYSYGARGGFSYSRHYGVLSAGAQVRTDATWQSTVEIWNELVALQSGKRPPAADELGRERNGNILALPARFATMSGVLGNYRDLIYFGLPLDYYKTFIARMSAVTAAQVAAAARQHMNPGKAVLFVVGDATAPQKQRVVKEGKKLDEPMVGADGKPVTLLDSLKQMVATGGPLAGGELVILDADGNVLPQQ